ncbi:MAG: DUF1156 domain-containing protein [Desulfitobacterium hafniense]|nr:DUF1156 domain-containing protein [Desulfitobacterium hafniense]
MGKKLIEVALPLEAINIASAREKQPGIGAHPRGLHLWWARRPQAAARAVIFAQMVDDPTSYVDTLLNDPKKIKVAEIELKRRLDAWNVRCGLYDDAQKNGDGSIPEPGETPKLEDCITDIERQRLFDIIEELVLWENTNNLDVLEKARYEILNSWRRTCFQNAEHPKASELFDQNKLPGFHDPFAGGGAIPLEAQRLGLASFASDLNPVAVLINKGMIEIPQKFAGLEPVNPDSLQKAGLQTWEGAQGLTEDIRYYGEWMRDKAEELIGNLYPNFEITQQIVNDRSDLSKYLGQKLPVIAYIWARTVKSPNPAFRHVDVPLVSNFMLSTKAGKEAYIEPVINAYNYKLTVSNGKPHDVAIKSRGTTVGKRGGFLCLMSNTPITYEYIREEGMAGRIGLRLMAIVAGGDRGRVYLPPTDEMEALALSANSGWKPETPLHGKCRVNVSLYGMDTYGDLYSPRQLIALSTFSDMIQDVRIKVKNDAISAGLSDDSKALSHGGLGATAYADAVAMYMAFTISRLADYNSSIATWKPSGEQVMQTFKRQALQMTWDFPESNVLGNSGICWKSAVKYTADNLKITSRLSAIPGNSCQQDASQQSISIGKVISTDPPYYDNIGYADLSDFFYVWLRRALKDVFPELFTTMAVPKAEELVATPYRHGSKEKAEAFFLEGMTKAMHCLAKQAHPAFPVTIYYAFKQSETEDETGTTRTGWETFLDAVIRAGFSLTGTWPIRTELANKVIGLNANVLASSIVLVCRQRNADALSITRREGFSALNS